MEYLGGGINLEDLVKSYGPQASARVAHILVQVCGALQEAHDAGLVHRDIKPGNIMLCERGGIPDVAKVLDFGLVKNFTADTNNSGEVVLGTAAYLAPEVLLEGAVGPAVDLYALGAVGYFLLTGKRMFEGKTTVAQVIQHVTSTPLRPSEIITGIDPALEEVIMQCLAKTPVERPASAATMASRLRRILQILGWDDDEAKQWWRTYRASTPPAPTPDEQTLTITVDLSHRDEA
jgi:serine/threonine-protein kinase